MTTDSPSHRTRPPGVAALGAGVLAGGVTGLVAAALAAALGGSEGLVGAFAGAGVTLLVLATGFATVDLVAGALPTASLMVALLTYTLQVVLLAALLVVLRSADDVTSTLTPGWFAAGVIAVAAAWTVRLVVHAMRARIPLYDLPERPAVAAAEGSER